MVCDGADNYKLVLESAELVVNTVQLSNTAQRKITSHLQSGKHLDIPILGSEILQFSTPPGQKENSTPQLSIPGTSRLLHLFWVKEKTFLGDRNKNPTYFPNMNLQRLVAWVGGRLIERQMEFESGKQSVSLAFQNTLNSLGGCMEGAFIKKDRWISAQTIHSFDLTSSGFYAPCLNMAATGKPEYEQSLAIQYQFGKAPTDPHQLLALLEKDQTLRILPDFSLQLSDEI